MPDRNNKNDDVVVWAGIRFFRYRNLVLGLPNKEFRDLQAGKSIKIKPALLEKNKQAYEVEDNGN